MGHFIWLDGLVEPLGATNLPVPAVDEVRVPAVSGDGNAVAMLQPAVASDVVAVVVGVDDQAQILWRRSKKVSRSDGSVTLAPLN